MRRATIGMRVQVRHAPKKSYTFLWRLFGYSVTSTAARPRVAYDLFHLLVPSRRSHFPVFRILEIPRLCSRTARPGMCFQGHKLKSNRTW